MHWMLDIPLIIPGCPCNSLGAKCAWRCLPSKHKVEFDLCHICNMLSWECCRHDPLYLRDKGPDPIAKLCTLLLEATPVKGTRVSDDTIAVLKRHNHHEFEVHLRCPHCTKPGTMGSTPFALQTLGVPLAEERLKCDEADGNPKVPFETASKLRVLHES